MKTEPFLVADTDTIQSALSKIEGNKHGIVFTTNDQGCVNGVATDGDIRRQLLAGFTLGDSIKNCVNRDFLWATDSTPREQLLKRLDGNIRTIPVLDSDKKLISIVSKEHLPLQKESAVYSRAVAPVRISFAGGGSDLTKYFLDAGGAAINATISLFSRASLRLRDDSKVIVSSLDLGEIIESPDISTFHSPDDSFKLIESTLKFINPDFGFELQLRSDYPMCSGLGGSSATTAAILGCFNSLRTDQWDLHELAELAYQIERVNLGVAGGWQDQYATIFGGFNFIEFSMDRNIVHPLRVHKDVLLELQECLVLCNTGIKHNSGEIHTQTSKNLSEASVRDLIKSNVAISFKMRNELLRGNLDSFGELLHSVWELKKQTNSKISDHYLDSVYNYAVDHGAIGGKLLGAGGGGFFLFYVPAFRSNELIQSLEERDLHVVPFQFEGAGLKAWKIRENGQFQA